jgi:dTDP-4-amino-4,6-dideoxygalactose transaminase
MLRDHGQSKKYHHDVEGYNGRLDSIQAGILRVKLRHLNAWNAQRRTLAHSYDRLFAATNGTIVPPHVPPWSRPVYHLYVVRVAGREAVQAHLTAQGIGTGIHYPIPLHRSRAYASLRFSSGDFPVAEEAAAQVISLPMFPQLSVECIPRIVTTLTECIRNRRDELAKTI